ncbi:MAG: hypothetical protein KF789_10910 [Bdellovibrionaceae bacterium]|nr:hypothetical protein [Pseudobdellovibrionaceae bacterium]
MKNLFKAFFAVSMIYLTSCQHGGAKITETPMGLTEIRRVVYSLMGDPRVVSAGGYEMDSKYHDEKTKPLDRPAEAKERYFTRVTILGDRRPYDLWIQVFAEVRTADGFESVGQDDLLAEDFADRLKKALHESRDKRNVIDDFKAF